MVRVSKHEKTIRSIISCLSGLNIRKLKGCEVGVWEGATSKELLCRLPTLYLYMVDSWKHEGNQVSSQTCQEDVDAALQTAKNKTKFAEERRCILRMTSKEASSRFSLSDLDFVFIDADHCYESVREDIILWWPKTKHILMGHDYNCRMDKKGKWGVKKAVDEFAGVNDLTVKTHPGMVWSISKV